MSARIIQIADDFWNIRGSFKIGGVVDVGTHASLVRRQNGQFLLLDACGLSDALEREVAAITDGGKRIDAVLHLHPFHTVHVRKMHERYPAAKLYGTARHVARYGELPWQDVRTDEPALHEQFADDFEFSVPAGVDFISANENVHFSSVLAYHRASRTIHVDDTLMYLRLPGLLKKLGPKEPVSFHPTLSQALERRPGAASDFRQWAQGLAERWRETENLCAAHNASLLSVKNRGASVHDRILSALGRVERTLAKHQRKYG